MSSILAPLFREKQIALIALAAFAFLISFTFLPTNAHAAAITLVTATTTSSNASSTLAKIGDTVSYQIVLSGTPAATTTPVINIFGMGTTSMSGAGTNWTYATTSSASWTEGLINFNFAWGGSIGEATTTATQANLTGLNVRFDKTAPVISSLTSTATTTGSLKVGDTITFTLTPASTELGGSVTGSYNGAALTWSTANGGVTYTATYTVVEGQTDQATALQISGVTIRDAAGNATVGAGSDIVRTIDANSPSAPTASAASGTYTAAQTLTFSSAGSNSIRYTLNGSTAPTCSVGNLYSGQMNLSISSSFMVIGCDTAGNASPVSSFTYSIQGGGGNRTGGGGGGGGAGSTTSTSGPVTNVVTPANSSTTSVTATPAVTSSTSTTSTGASKFTHDLKLGSVSADVKALQVFLNTHGFVIAAKGTGSTGHETNSFGARTKAALAKFQASKGITPASGYFGAKTRAAIGGM